MKTLKQDWLIWIMLLVPFIFIAIFWDRFPDQIATHFDMNGKPNGWSDKSTGLFLMSGLNVGMYFLFLVLPKIDPKKAKFALFMDKYQIIRLVLHTFFTFIFFITTLPALGLNFNNALWVLYGVLVLFLLLGNYMGNVRHNYFVGVRTPWTLANEEVWTKTHRLTAKLWVYATLVMMVVLPFVPNPEIIFLPYVILISVIPIVYSYVIFKKINTHEN